MNQNMQILASSETQDWHTPSWVIEMVREVLGEIELDPASSVQANEAVKAKRFFDQATDGLRYCWHAETVFLNPPFGKSGNDSLAGIWIERMAKIYRAGCFREGIALTHTRSGYEWWEKLSREFPICMTRQKIDFIPAAPRTKTSGSKTSQTFFYFGKNLSVFSRVFSRIGRII